MIEELVEVLCVGVAVNVGKEALLGRIEEGGNSRHNSASHGTSQETVVRVGDADRAGVGDQAGLLLWEEEQKTVIKARGGSGALEEGLEDTE